MAGRKYSEVERALIQLEEWAVERMPDDGRFVTERKDAVWIVTQAFRSCRARAAMALKATEP